MCTSCLFIDHTLKELQVFYIRLDMYQVSYHVLSVVVGIILIEKKVTRSPTGVEIGIENTLWSTLDEEDDVLTQGESETRNERQRVGLSEN